MAQASAGASRAGRRSPRAPDANRPQFGDRFDDDVAKPRGREGPRQHAWRGEAGKNSASGGAGRPGARSTACGVA